MSADPELYYIVDVRKNFHRNPYITFWRAANAGYAYPRPWAGIYTQTQIDIDPDYYYLPELVSRRFPVRILDALDLDWMDPNAGDIDGNVGPILLNTARVRAKLLKMAYVPPSKTPNPAHEPMFPRLRNRA